MYVFGKNKNKKNEEVQIQCVQKLNLKTNLLGIIILFLYNTTECFCYVIHMMLY